MSELGRSEQYLRELFRITRAKKIPPDWASPDQRCRAAIKAVGQYGRVNPLNRKQAER